MLVTVVRLAGAVALLLWGIRMVQTGIQRALGARLRVFLATTLRNRFSSLAAGLSVTAILQSSTATCLMVTGFAAGGLVDLVPALSVMLGANVGTTLSVQALSFDVSAMAPALVLVGFLMFRRATAGLRDFGRVLIGLGLVLIALHQFIALLTAYQAAPALRSALSAISSQPVLDVVVATGLTYAAHSSVAVILLIMSLVTNGAVDIDAALALVLGANLGTALNPVLEGAVGKDPACRRLPLGNLLNRIVGIGAALFALPWLTRWITWFEPDAARVVADFHTAFNLVLALVFLPLLTPYAALLRRWLPARVNESDPSRPLYLDVGAREIPAVALGGAAREALRMTDALEEMLHKFRDVLERPDRRQITEGKRLDDILGRLNSAIKADLVSLDPGALSEGDYRRVTEIVTFAMNIEQAGDEIDSGLLGTARKQLQRGAAFAKEGKAELIAMTDRLLANARQAANLFVTEDVRADRLLANEKSEFRDLEAKAISSHFQRLQFGELESTETSTLHLDMLRQIKLVNSHLVAAAAYPILERSDGLLRSRLRSTANESLE